MNVSCQYSKPLRCRVTVVSLSTIQLFFAFRCHYWKSCAVVGCIEYLVALTV